MILTIKKRTLIVLLAIGLLFVSVLAYFCASQTFSPALQYTIVIDAGHGGLDVK